uniref:C-type lectin domain-containing protein n=1 Tax=Daphnia galeata TaxID=27404 RepID=A0A8J2RBV6_9CRUS|nr:unnamed protein product [Daphnia galeata]
MEENKNQEEQLTEYKEKLAVLSSPDKSNSSQEINNCNFLLESEKKKYQDLEEILKKKEIESTKENEILNTKVQNLTQEMKNQEEQLTGYKNKEKLLVLSTADKNNSTQEILNSKILLESEKKKYQDLEEISKKKEIELTKENEILNTKVQNLTQEIKNQEEQLTGYKNKEKLAVLSSVDKNNSSQEIINCKLLLENEKKKYKDLEEVLKKKEIELTKEIEVLNTKVNSLLEVIQSQEKQLTGYKNKEKLTILTSAEIEKNNSTKEMNKSLEIEKKKYQDLEEISKKKEIELTKENEVLNTKVKSLTEEIQSQEEQLTGYKNREKLAILSAANFSREMETLNNKIEMCNKETFTLRQSSETIAEENQKLKISLTDCKNRKENQTLSVGNLDKTIGTPELKLGNNKSSYLTVNCDIDIPVSVEDYVIINATVHANSNCNWDWQFETKEDRILDGWNGQKIRFEKPKLNNVTSKILPEVAYTTHSTARVRFNNPNMFPLALIPQLKVQKGNQSSQMNYCNNHQMKLLSIETKEKHKAIFSVWGQKYIFMTSGKGTKLDNRVKVWNWNSTGEKITYTNWLPGEPNNVFDHDVCIAAHSPGWDDIPCSGHTDLNYEAICEAHP